MSSTHSCHGHPPNDRAGLASMADTSSTELDRLFNRSMTGRLACHLIWARAWLEETTNTGRRELKPSAHFHFPEPTRSSKHGT